MEGKSTATKKPNSYPIWIEIAGGFLSVLG